MRAELLTSLTLKHFRSIPRSKRRTFTLDNGSEFSDWERLEKGSGAIVYFAYPYHFWERGANENTNGLLRQYFPKSMDFNLITPEELRHAVRRTERPSAQTAQIPNSTFRIPEEVSGAIRVLIQRLSGTKLELLYIQY